MTLCTHLLTCPVCHTVLSKSDQSLKCGQQHSFDLAKEGYVNLLLKKLPGDTREMLLARRAFLEGGYYRPLSDTLNQLVATHLDDTPVNILDAGCGEGYYLGRLQHALAQRQSQQAGCYIGVDISKEAVRMAAKHYRDVLFVVANLKERLVFADQTFNVMLNVFAPRNAQEYARVIVPGGVLIVVIPGPAHLLQLRSTLHLLSIEEDKQQHVIEQFADQFDLTMIMPVTYEQHLTKPEIALAVMMTPNYWHLSDQTRQAMEELTELQTQVAFTCLVLQRKRNT